MIDFRNHDQHEYGGAPSRTSADIALEYSVDLRVAQRARERMREQGMRVPLTEAERFDEAEKRMRGQG